ncbi:zinc finger, C3HC4 type [Ancylostoma ceylanicum]|uniref:Zinc finger, C3HC4 type n=1 Tax=Ancylostoma ceylanicum TaxID=53326 RepID=A0A0D6LZZ6_9BILA|nr:zinc finger, C3HC4 type [Ancylostoma ceylanicum]
MASRCSSEYTQGYVFSERPIRNNEKVVIEVVSVQQLYKGGLAFGVTCCDPSTLRSTDLPDDSSDLIEMPQYWVGIKDIALQPRVNTVLSFWITDAVRDEANGTAGVPLPNLLDDDFDENNASSRTRPVPPPRRGIDEAVLRRTVDDLLTDAPPVAPIPRPPPLAPRPSLSASSATRAKSAQLSVGRESSDREEGPQGDDTDECTVCMSARVNSALYKCGHSCMCYDCAMQTYRSSGLCPLCRASIMDVIKIFKA